VVIVKTLEYVDNGITICGYTLNDLRFADDIAVVSDSRQNLQSVVGRIANTSHRMSMRISTEKKRIQHIGRHPKSMTITINQQKLKQTKQIHLNLHVPRSLDADKETKEQATSSRDGMSPKNPWCVKNLSHQKYRHQESA